MRRIAVIESKEREALFRNTAAKMRISEAVVEKDFWVCYIRENGIRISSFRTGFKIKKN